MTAASMSQSYEDSIKARWRGGPTVLAFLFAHPDSDAILALDARGDYFDLENEGFTWDFTATVSGAAADTRGRLTMYNARGADLDWFHPNVDPNDPTAALDPSHNGDCAISAVGCPSGAPQIITADFVGIAI